MSERKPNVLMMGEHIEKLIAELQAGRPEDNNITVCWIEQADDACALRDLDGEVLELQLPRIRSEEDYATCLHEIGHVIGPDQDSDDDLTRERGAWQWAREHACAWTLAMERDAQAALRCCESMNRG